MSRVVTNRHSVSVGQSCEDCENGTRSIQEPRKMGVGEFAHLAWTGILVLGVGEMGDQQPSLIMIPVCSNSHAPSIGFRCLNQEQNDMHLRTGLWYFLRNDRHGRERLYEAMMETEEEKWE